MINTMNEIKDRVDAYQKLLGKKEEILKQYQSWTSLYEDAQRVLEEIEITYNASRTPEIEEKYNSWVQEKADYLEIISEYAKELEEVNQELAVYDEVRMNEQAEYIALMTKFQELSNQMKEIEKRSKKIANGAEIGTNLVMVENAEGRKTKINEHFAADYSILSMEKRNLAKKLRKQYNKVINIIEDEKEEVQEIEITPAEPIKQVSEHAYDNLSTEEKIKQLEEKMEFYRNASGRKCTFTYCGEKITMSRYYKGAFLVCASELKRLQKQLVNPNAPQLENKRDDFYQAVEGTIEPPKVDAYEENSEFQGLKEDLIRIVNERYTSVKKDDVVTTGVVKQDKPKGFMKIINVAKSIDKEKLKSKIKKAAIVFAATTMVVATSIAVSIASKMGNNKKDTITPNQYENTEDLTVDDNVWDVEIDDDAYDNIVNEETKETSAIKLGDKFFVNGGEARIYNTMYDATLERNGLSPYFDLNMERSIGGLAVNYEGELYFFYSHDANAQANVDALLQNGGSITAILGANENGYEGFYNISDVVVLNNTMGGISR